MPTANLPPAVEQLLSLYGIKQKSISPFQLAQFGQQFSNKDEMLSTLANYGQGQQQQIDEQFTNAGNELLAHSAGAGLDLTSQYTSNGLGVAREKRLATGTLNDQLLGHKLDILGGNNQTLQALLGSAAQANFQQDSLNQQNALANRSLSQQWAMSTNDPHMQATLAALNSANSGSSETKSSGAFSGPQVGGFLQNLKFLGIR